MRKKQKLARFGLGLACLFLPAGILWGLLLYQTDASREALLEEVLTADSVVVPAPMEDTVETSPPKPQVVDTAHEGSDPRAQSLTASLFPLLSEADDILHDPAGVFCHRVEDGWQEVKVTRERAPSMLEKSEDWAARIDAALRGRGTHRVWESESSSASAAISLLFFRHRAHAVLGEAEAHKVDLMTLGRLYAIFHNTTFSRYPPIFVEEFNQEFAWSNAQSALGDEDLEELIGAIRSNPRWNPAHSMRESRRYFAARFKQWAELTPIESFNRYGPVNGIGTYLWKSPSAVPCSTATWRHSWQSRTS